MCVCVSNRIIHASVQRSFKQARPLASISFSSNGFPSFHCRRHFLVWCGVVVVVDLVAQLSRDTLCPAKTTHANNKIK